jgi:hypothetical protein
MKQKIKRKMPHQKKLLQKKKIKNQLRNKTYLTILPVNENWEIAVILTLTNFPGLVLPVKFTTFHSGL